MTRHHMSSKLFVNGSRLSSSRIITQSSSDSIQDVWGGCDQDATMRWWWCPEQPPLKSVLRPKRDLGESNNDNDYYKSFMYDSSGNEYEPYSLAWRYLGMYIDCDLTNGEGNDNRQRHLDSEEEEGDCERVLLWAAYVDHSYSGHSIGEYQFFDVERGQYDSSTCQRKRNRCKPLDCHNPDPRTFELIGVFKESDGLVDWAEQLFKHQGYCIWDSNTYDSMESRRNRWPTYCMRLYYFVDADGNSLYPDILPESEGNITMGVFTDDKCSQPSESISWLDYVTSYYNYYGTSDQAEEAVAAWEAAITSWNNDMAPYKACQPCRAYNLNSTSQGGSDYMEEGDNSNHQRLLSQYDNDGQGDEEPYGYNCYDNAGYTNCNQCYKFFAKTTLEPATVKALQRASAQGTILEIEVDGVRYGSGGYRSPPTPVSYLLPFGAAAILGTVLGMTLFLVHENIFRRHRQNLSKSLREDGGDSLTNSESISSFSLDEGRKSDGFPFVLMEGSDQKRQGRNVRRLTLSKSVDSISSRIQSTMGMSLESAADMWPEQTMGSTFDRSVDNAVGLFSHTFSTGIDSVDELWPVNFCDNARVQREEGENSSFDVSDFSYRASFTDNDDEDEYSCSISSQSYVRSIAKEIEMSSKIFPNTMDQASVSSSVNQITPEDRFEQLKQKILSNTTSSGDPTNEVPNASEADSDSVDITRQVVREID